MEISKIAIVGAGTMGANIALSFAEHGKQVWLFDSDASQLDNAARIIRENARLLRQHELMDEAVDVVSARVICETKLENAVLDAELVIEAVPEKLQLKCWIFTKLDRLCRAETILASNTSSFVPSNMALGLVNAERKKRFMVMHFWNPAHLMPLVEIVPHAETLPEVVERVRKMLSGCDKTAVVLRKEVPGFIGNRLAFALQREAMDLVAKGIVSPQDIDAVVKASFGRRIPVTGVFGTADLGGLDVYLEVCRSLFPDLCNETSPPISLKRLVEQGKLGVKAGAGWSHYDAKQASDLRESFAEELIHQLKREQMAKKKVGVANRS